jgi:hypothetical protein
MGDSVGHYEGDTLVVDTVGVALGPRHLPMIDRYGTPRSAALHVVERYHLIDGKTAKEAAERQMQEDGPRFAAAVLVDPAYPAPDCSSPSRSRIRTSSPHRGRRWSPTDVRPGRGFARLLRRTRALYAGRGDAGFLIARLNNYSRCAPSRITSSITTRTFPLGCGERICSL